MVEQIRRSKALQLGGLLGPAGLWIGLFFIAPLLIIVAYSFATRGEAGRVDWTLTANNYLTLLTSSDLLRIFLRSFGYAVLTTILCLLIGYPMAVAMVKSPPSRRNMLVFLVMIPFWTNFIVRTYAWKVLLNNNGVINNILRGFDLAPIAIINTPTAVMIGLVYGALPFMILPLYTAIEKFDFTLMEAAADLGANLTQSFFRVMVPMTLPGIVAGSVLVFIPTVGQYVVPDILGGAKVAMLGNTLALQFGSARNWPLGSAIALIFMVMLTAAVMIYFRTVPEEERA
jgi:spermidine/putrescine transport system permease protein